MAALTANVNVSSEGTPKKSSAAANAADTFFAGAIVWSDTGGGVQVTAAAGDRPVGICSEKQIVSAGDLVEYYTFGDFWFPAGSITAADELDRIGFDAATLTDNIADAVNVTGLTLATNDVVLGKIMRVANSRMLIHIGDLTGDRWDATLGAWE